MKRNIVAFSQNQHGHWVAELDCYHTLNDAVSPTAQAGNRTVNCLQCDALKFPEGLTAYKKTPTFREASIPKGLRQHHTTKLGTWGLIHVLDGTLTYIHEQEDITPINIKAGETAAVPPCMPHHVHASGTVTFFVEFYKKIP